MDDNRIMNKRELEAYIAGVRYTLDHLKGACDEVTILGMELYVMPIGVLDVGEAIETKIKEANSEIYERNK